MKLPATILLPLNLLLPFLPSTLALPTAGTEKLGPRSGTVYSDRHAPIFLSRRQTTATARAVPVSTSTNLNMFLALITQLFPINLVVSKLSGLITAAETTLAAVAGIDTTENDVVSGNCADMTIIFSRGTTETGNVGVLAGPPFFEAVMAGMAGDASLAVQGVDYPADIPGFLKGGDPAGSQKMADLVTQALTQCPSTRIVMSGYSQGGQLVHNAAKLLPAATMDAVSSVVIFGDPNNGQEVANAGADDTLVICHKGDNICDHGDLILLPHLTYAENAQEAANFVITSAGAIG